MISTKIRSNSALVHSSLVAIILFHSVSVSAGAPAKRQLAVVDIVEMTDLAEPDIKLLSMFDQPASFSTSPDGEKFAFVTRKGNVKLGKNFYSLVVMEDDEVSAFLNDQSSSGKVPVGRTTVRFSSSEKYQWENAIRQLRWLPDNRTLTFLGEDDDAPSQVFSVDVLTGARVQLTHHARPVWSFSYDSESKRVVYVSTIEEPSRTENVSSYSVGTTSLNHVLFPWETGFSARLHQFFVADVGKGDVVAIGPPFRAVLPSPLWLSPNGQRAIALQPVNDAGKLRKWAASYNSIQSDVKQYLIGDGGERFDAAFMRRDVASMTQFVLLDLKTRTVRALFDAPTGYAIGGYNVDIHWMRDSENVVLANTLLPLEVAASAERKRRSEFPAIAQYNIRTGSIDRMAEIPPKVSASDIDGTFLGLKYLTDEMFQVAFSSQRTACVRYVHGRWRSRDEECPVTIKSTRRTEVLLTQDMNTPPDISVRDKLNGKEKKITDLNPQFRELTFGRVELFDWRDMSGADWRGGLLYPPDYDAKKRYPLVIQTYGFNPRVFIIDHQLRGSSAFAAQALANEGLLVLLLPEPRVDSQSREWLLSHQRGVESAIDVLDEMKLIDRKKIGIIGFSATGLPVQHLITFSDYDVLAATIADSWGISLYAYVASLFGTSSPGPLSGEDMIEATPWGDGLKRWTERDPSLHVDRISAAVRLEQYSPLSAYWDMYALMRRQHKAADLVVFPNGWHQLRNPKQRLDSLQGNVDWFTFWLLNREDQDSSKAEQYLSWRRLRQEKARHE